MGTNQAMENEGSWVCKSSTSRDTLKGNGMEEWESGREEPLPLRQALLAIDGWGSVLWRYF